MDIDFPPSDPIRRIVVKLSGEALGGRSGVGIDFGVLKSLAAEVREAAVHAQVALVLGAGNFVRGASMAGVERTTGDHMGMLATIMNALAFRDVLRSHGSAADVLSSRAVSSMVDGYSVDRANELLDMDSVVLLAGGTGNPLFTTDTAACLRGVELHAHLVVKATKVDGVYSADPQRDPSATRFETLSHLEVIERRLEVMDLTAITLCREHDLPLVVCDIGEPGALTKAAMGAKVGTWIGSGRPS